MSKHKIKYLTFVSLVLVFLVILSTEARAEMYDLWQVVENNSGMPGTVAAQLSVDVTDPGGGQVLFTFSNDGPETFFIADIYFDDGALLGIASVDDSDPGVIFGFPAAPTDLPGGGTVSPPFETSSADNPPTPPHFSADVPGGGDGVHDGESVGIVFDLEGGYTFANVIDALNVGFDPDTYYTGSGAYDGWTAANLRIGVHIQGIDGPWGDDRSDTYILVPLPGAVLLGILGLGVVGLKLRKHA